MAENPIKILVIEDEMLIAAKVSMYLNELGYEVAGIFASAEEALHFLQAYPSDIALVDIQLKGSMDGIALARVLQDEYRVPVIFLTASFDDATFALAKETKPYAFLAKPLNKLDLRRALELTVSHISDADKPEKTQPKQPENTALPDRIFVHHGEKKVKILLDTILYIQAERNYCRIITKEKEYLLSIPMKSLEAELPPDQFQRIHRSHIVNLKHVDEVGENSVVIGGKTLVMSKSYQQEFLQRIKSI